MDSTENILSRICPALAEKLGVSPDEITPEDRFVEDLGADSLDVVELLMAAEQEFRIRIADDALEKVFTVGDAAEMISACQQDAAEEERKRQEEMDRKLKELGPARIAWAALEEKQADEYISATGLPYFTYDGIQSTDDGCVSGYMSEKDEAIEAGRYREWLLAKASWFIGKPVTALDIESVSDILALTRSIKYEKVAYQGFDMFSRFGCGCHLVVMPDGERREMMAMAHIGSALSSDILSECVISMLPQTMSLYKTDRKDVWTLCEGVVESVNYTGGWEMVWSYRVNGKGRKNRTCLRVNPALGDWASLNGRHWFLPVDTAAYGREFKDVCRFMCKLEREMVKKLLLERVSFKFGIRAKSITLSLAEKVAKINKVCSKLISNGDGMFTTRDGRQYIAYDILNPSAHLSRDILSVLIDDPGFGLMLRIDGEMTGFMPSKYIGYNNTKGSVILEGSAYGESWPKKVILGISLNGGKCHRFAGEGLSMHHIKGDVELVSNTNNKAVIDRMSLMLGKVFAR